MCVLPRALEAAADQPIVVKQFGRALRIEPGRLAFELGRPHLADGAKLAAELRLGQLAVLAQEEVDGLLGLRCVVDDILVGHLHGGRVGQLRGQQFDHLFAIVGAVKKGAAQLGEHLEQNSGYSANIWAVVGIVGRHDTSFRSSFAGCAVSE